MNHRARWKWILYLLALMLVFRLVSGRRSGPRADVSDDLVKTLMTFDRNGDGKLDRSELPERMQGIFDRADTNKDGFLTPEEIKTLARAQALPNRR
jgi:Ca2+-binding EF-hand superfamily protein